MTPIKEKLRDMKENRKAKKQKKKELLSSMTTSEKKKYHMKKALIIVVIIFAVLALSYLIIDNINFRGEKAGKNEAVSRHSSTKQKDEKYPTYNAFSAKPYDADIFSDEDYRNLDYNIKYEQGFDGGNVIYIHQIDQKHEGHRFFEKYFNILQKGSRSGYSSLFDKSYVPGDNFEKYPDRKKSNKEFPPQMVYDISVKELQRIESEDDGCIYGTYYVSYKIYRNDNLFRSDIGHDSINEKDVARPLIFETKTTNPGKSNELTTIRAMYTMSSIPGSDK